MNAIKRRKERNELERIMKSNEHENTFKEQQPPSKKLKKTEKSNKVNLVTMNSIRKKNKKNIYNALI